MKHVISISLGSSERDHKVETEILGEQFIIERRGTDGDLEQATSLFNELDGHVDAFGLGGIDLYVYAGEKRYTFRDARKLIKGIRHTPVVDGSGLKNTLERKAVGYIDQEYGYNLKGKKVLMVCAMDRFGMAQALIEAGCDIIFGDIVFALGLPIPLKRIESLEKLARVLCPVVTKLPFKLLYPTGNKQEENSKDKYRRFYEDADLIAGDFHYIKRYLPEDVSGKAILTNTVTEKDVEMLKERGLNILITTTPDLNGRSFGTNVMEGVLVSLAQKELAELNPEDYEQLIDEIGFTPRVEVLNQIEETESVTV
mgnify:CR=1 FL=1